MAKFGVGQPVRRVEDQRFLTGQGRYVDDIVLPGMKFAVVARPPVVGGKVASLDSSAAMKVPGVEKIVTLAPTPAPAHDPFDIYTNTFFPGEGQGDDGGQGQQGNGQGGQH